MAYLSPIVNIRIMIMMSIVHTWTL